VATKRVVRAVLQRHINKKGRQSLTTNDSGLPIAVGLHKGDKPSYIGKKAQGQQHLLRRENAK
jgi:hypothetical protein